MAKTRHLFATVYPWAVTNRKEETMQAPISIAPFLWWHQTETKPDFTITKGKGRQGIIIRTRSANYAQRVIRSIKSVIRGKA
jgi:hypothetical protein